MKTTKIPQMFRQAVGVACIVLLAGTGAGLMGQQPPPPAQAPPAQGPPQGQFAQLLPPEQLNDLVAPIALYPDNLLGQVLVAATYPLEVVEASQWLQQNRGLQGQQLVDAARQQNWDPSIQALVVFPDVLNRLNSDIRWTTDLGNAFLAQQNDVMSAVQQMRARARSAGKLNSNQQETVTTQNQGGPPVIEIAPANPQVVYVPVYDPSYIWGPPAWGYYPPLYYPPFGYGFGFGSGIYIGGFFGGLGWGGWGWGLNWFGGGIFLNAGFFNHYGFGGYGAGFRGGLWAHNPEHRLGVSYPNSALSARYANASRASLAGRANLNARAATSGFAAQRGASFGGSNRPAAAGAQSGGWSRFGAPGSGGSVVAPRSGSSTQSATRTAGGFSNFGGANARSAPASGGSSAYRASPSTGGGYSGGRAAPSYRSSPSSGGGGFRSAPSSHGGGGGGGSHGGGGGSHGGGRR